MTLFSIFLAIFLIPNQRRKQSYIRGRVMKNYHTNIFYSEEDEAYIADIPDLKYCSASDDTPQQHEFELEY